jgi:YegS/Rv2252/BmrU family lipid kinase
MQHVDYCFIVNPAAGGGHAGRDWPALHQQLQTAGLRHCYYLSEYQGHSRELVLAALEDGHKKFVVVGGDGTANEVLNGLCTLSMSDLSEISLAVIPWGTGNDWAAYYGLSPRVQDCVRLLQTSPSGLQDIGKVTYLDSAGHKKSHYFLNCAGTGFDSYVLEEMGTIGGSRLRYFLCLLKCLYKFRATKLAMDVDGESLECPALMLGVCLGKFAGAGMQFAPEAVIDDGLFDVLLIKDLSVPQILASLRYLYNGRINDHRAMRHWRGRSVSIAGQTGQQFQCDGELLGQLPVKIEILPQALRVIAPQENR